MLCWQVFKATLDGVQTVAVKQLLERSPYQQQKFVNEIAILRSCRNENIVCFLGKTMAILHIVYTHNFDV